MQRRMVVRLADGSRLKGFSHDFVPGRSRFHLQEVTPGDTFGTSHDISIDDVHAIFFVHDFAFDRDRRYTEENAPRLPTDPPAEGGWRLKVACVWGEVLEGLSYGYEEDRPGFFVFPTRPLERAYNLDRAYLTRAAVRTIERPPAA